MYKKKLTFLDFFAGIGGFHSGLQQAGHRCVGYVEWDKYARQSYQAMYDVEGVYTGNDIRNIKGKELPNADIWCFGSPCTNISLAGNRTGLKGDASSLFFEIIRCLRERIKYTENRTEQNKTEVQMPTYLFMENVKNLLSVNGGWDFAKVIIEMDKVGYDVEWQVVNSAWTIPQNRERIFVVGHRRGVKSNRIFPITSKEFDGNRNFEILRDVLDNNIDYKYYLNERQTEILIKNGGIINVPTEDNKINVVGNVSNSRHHSGRVLSVDGISSTLTASQYKHPTTIAYGENKNLIIRRLTPRECWRLQGFSDEQFEKVKATGMSDTQLYKQAGNAVTVSVIYTIAKKF